MISVVFEGPSPSSARTTVREVDVPGPGPRQVAIDVEFAGVNFIDVMARRGDAGYVSAWPYRPGFEVAGTVRATGRSVTGLHVGDRVAAFTHGGGLAEVVVAEECLTSLVPAGVPSAHAAAAPLMLSTAMLLLRDVGHLTPGESVLMHAAGGGVGRAVAQLARALGAGDLHGTVGSAEKVESARASGWDQVVVRADIPGRRAAPTLNDDFDVILDPLGTQMLAFDVAHAAPGGRIVLFGNPSSAEFAALPPIGQLIGATVSIGGFSMRKLTQTAPHRVSRALRDVLSLLGDGAIEVPVHVVGSLGAVAEVHDTLASGHSVGKFVVDVAGGPGQDTTRS